jgi:hypothetical protein
VNDEQVLERLRAGLDDLTSSIGVEPPALERPAAGSVSYVGSSRDRWRWVVAAAAGVLVVAATSAVWFTARGRQPADRSVVGVAPTTTPPMTTVIAVERLPVPPTPEGWKVIEFGDVRLSVPPGWATTRCNGEPEPATVTLCGRGDGEVTIGPASLDADAGRAKLNGLRFVGLVADCVNSEGEFMDCDAIELVDLDVRVAPAATDYAIADAILESVGVSGRWRAAHEPLPPVPDDWQEIQTMEGVTFSVPPDWTTLDLTETAEHPPAGCDSQLGGGLVIVGDSLVDLDCPAPSPFGDLVSGVRVDPTTELPDRWPVWDEVVDVDGRPVTVRVGFGEDSQVALAIIGSIRTTQPDPSSGNTVPGSTTPASAAPAGSQLFDPLDITLIFETSEVPSGGELASTMTIANHSGHEIVDPDCRRGSAAYGVVPADDPNAELSLRSTADCGGPFAMPDGFEATYAGPTFLATTSTGEPLPPGDYLAVYDLEDRSEPLRYPITVTPFTTGTEPQATAPGTTKPTDSGAATAALDQAVDRWERSAPPGYYLWVQGSIDGIRVSRSLLVDNGKLERVDGDPNKAFTVNELFRIIADAIGSGATVDVDYDDTWGYPSRLVTTGADRDVDLAVQEFRPFTRPTGCESPPESPTDLSAEPAAWLLTNQFTRWTDTNGCPIRVDVISHYNGAEHCDWQQIEFVTIGTPPGTPFSNDRSSHTYVWDPHDTLNDNIDRGRVIDIAELPAAAVDTGFRQGDSELWLDPTNPNLAYRVTGNTADVLVQDSPRQILCR